VCGRCNGGFGYGGSPKDGTPLPAPDGAGALVRRRRLQRRRRRGTLHQPARPQRLFPAAPTEETAGSRYAPPSQIPSHPHETAESRAARHNPPTPAAPCQRLQRRVSSDPPTLATIEGECFPSPSLGRSGGHRQGGHVKSEPSTRAFALGGRPLRSFLPSAAFAATGGNFILGTRTRGMPRVR